ncbi:hypothetical protein ACWHAM_12590 [Paenibacillus terrae]|uniref:Transposase n=1 Tax=Paenibacillus terrae (strain HPL-003) TaxID=985665 RepID=G7VY31_PAETH|nr:hypothetical protein [Paenibacillus terrae]AET57209.1 hypothetical protein HPL003_02140 [Paenibacillus terrae HPL-003]
MTTNHKGKQVTKQRYVQIAAVAAVRLKEDATEPTQAEDEAPVTYRGAYLLISNRFDAPEETVTYLRNALADRGVFPYSQVGACLRKVSLRI